MSRLEIPLKKSITPGWELSILTWAIFQYRLGYFQPQPHRRAKKRGGQVCTCPPAYSVPAYYCCSVSSSMVGRVPRVTETCSSSPLGRMRSRVTSSPGLVFSIK